MIQNPFEPMPHPKPNAVPTPDQSDVDKAEEERYTNQILASFTNPFKINQEHIGEYAQFYSDNKEAGCAFHRLEHIFKKVDAFIGIKTLIQSP
jgi:hypothetical protein